MRNSVAKKLRKEAGAQTSTSNRLEYEFLKKEHMRTDVHPKLKTYARQTRIGRVWKTTSTINTSPRRKIMKIAKLKG